ncbi:MULTISPECIES: class I SAM-dependent methyltransferase [unclassified Virgibacillus]|uniref:class I SAM-dependent methyltransferase n=1 Tax=unclassified Virgibacillus TaxID=2620237 RepID=UPI0024DE908F|nr:class I SAM-dependent methyltransferase [Virgibacillus sp. LDC-1]
MEENNVTTLFEWLDKTTAMVETHSNEPYLDSLSIVLDIAFYERVSEFEDEILIHKMDKAIKELAIESYGTEEIRKAVQLVILKGMKNSTQQQHLMTPETVALIMGYLASKLTENLESIRLFDPACGTGNLLTIVMDHLKQPLATFASDVDSTLIKLALANANLQKKDITFFHQDSLRPLLLDPVDLTIADLPVGYYPDDVQASEFELKAKEGHAYSHHLFIEQGVRYTKDGGYLIFVVPNSLFETEQAKELHRFIHQYAHIIGFLQLPESLFKSQTNAKSILIIQKKGNHTAAPKQPLLVKLPSFKHTHAMEDVLAQMNSWFASYQKRS